MKSTLEQATPDWLEETDSWTKESDWLAETLDSRSNDSDWLAETEAWTNDQLTCHYRCLNQLTPTAGGNGCLNQRLRLTNTETDDWTNESDWLAEYRFFKATSQTDWPIRIPEATTQTGWLKSEAWTKEVDWLTDTDSLINDSDWLAETETLELTTLTG